MKTARIVYGIVIVLLATLTAPIASAENEPGYVYQTAHSVSHLDSGRDIAIDAEGNAYVLAYALAQGGFTNGDVVVLKLDPSGHTLWTRSLSGSALDTPGGIAVGPAGYVYVAGRTLSNDFPVVNAMQPTRIGSADAFIAKLDPADGALIFSTYFGGTNDERCDDIAVGDAGEIYFVGATVSRDIPRVNALQDEIADYNGLLYDIYVGKLSSDGQTLLYGTYLGGNFDDFGDGIGVDAAGNIYISGRTESDDWPVVNAAQPLFADGGRDLFVARISADGAVLDYSTFLGGEDLELLGGMDVDAAGNVYLAGSTRSQYFPTTPGAFQETFVGEVNGCGQPPFEPIYNCEDMFVTKLGPAGDFAFSTFLGGMHVDEARAVAVGRGGAVYAGGYAASGFPLADASNNLVACKLTPDGSDLLYTVDVFSGSANQGGGLAVGPDGDVYFTGAINVPADVYVARFDEGPAGDLNGDGCVDLADLSILLAAYGTSAGGDLDLDADTDLADLSLLLASWGDGC